MNSLNLAGGLLLVACGITYVIYIYNKAKKDDKYDSFSYYYDIKSIIGIIVFIMIGITLIYNELKFILWKKTLDYYYW